MATWQLQKAKTHFSEVIDDAQTKGPQIITKHGTETAVVLSLKEYRSLAQPALEPKMSLLEFLQTAPKFETDKEYEEFMDACLQDRNDTGRDVEYLFRDGDEREEPMKEVA